LEIINSFFGALTGFWIVFEFKDNIISSWYSFIPLILLFMLMYTFDKFVNPPENSFSRLSFFLASLGCSLIVSTALQIIETPEMHLIEFICLPKTWLLTVILILWALNLYVLNIEKSRRGE
jgi:branched-subunit amino acid ABC-type transport system permease component